MKACRIFACMILTLLSACHRLPPPIPMTSVAPGPLLRELDQRRRSCTSVKALARIETGRKGRVRRYESVAVILKGQDRFRIEAFGPLAESLFALAWDGREVLYRQSGDSRVMSAGPAGFERMTGLPLSPAEVGALLTGNAPPSPKDAETGAYCDANGKCIVVFISGNFEWRVHLMNEPGKDPVVEGWDRYDAGAPAIISRFASIEPAGAYLFPRRLTIQCPARSAQLTVEYDDVDVNVPVADSVFTLGAASEGR